MRIYHKKEDPEKYCKVCGKRMERKRLSNGKWESMHDFNRRKYCSMDCMKQAFRSYSKPPKTIRNGRAQAQEMMPMSMCQICGHKLGMDVHHIDHNPLNNSLENLIRVCRSCHNRLHKQRATCEICGKPAKGYNLCEKHYQRYKKYGSPFLTKNNQFTDIEIDKEDAELYGKPLLQSIPDWYEWKGKFPDGKIKDTSDTQRYKMLGNGWNVEVIKHIFSFIDIVK